MFKKDKYCIIRQAIPKDLATFVANYFSMKKIGVDFIIIIKSMMEMSIK